MRGRERVGGPTLTASARLIVDPSGTSAGQLTDETVVLGQSGGQWLVTGLSVPPLRTQGSGPHVLSVSVTPPAKGALNPESVLTITFDSDLDPSSVTSNSLWLETAGGHTIPLLEPLAYDADTRQVTLTVSGAVPAGTEVVVGTVISDIDGGHPPHPGALPGRQLTAAAPRTWRFYVWAGAPTPGRSDTATAAAIAATWAGSRSRRSNRLRRPSHSFAASTSSGWSSMKWVV